MIVPSVGFWKHATASYDSGSIGEKTCKGVGGGDGDGGKEWKGLT